MDEELDESEELICEQHGQAQITYVCEHLISNPVQKWYSDYPGPDSPWPDAWCAVCNAHYVKEGEWNEHNEDLVPIKLLCNFCYEDARSASLAQVDDVVAASWEQFLDTCYAELQDKTDALSARFSLGSYQRYDWNQETGELVFSNDGVPAVIADFDFIGSYSSKSNTWLWAWANFHLLEALRSAVEAVRDHGEKHDYPWLTTAKWSAEGVNAWEMAAIAAHILNAEGVYRSPREGGATFLLMRNVRQV